VLIVDFFFFFLNFLDQIPINNYVVIYVGLMWSLFLNRTSVFEWNMTRFVFIMDIENTCVMMSLDLVL
jgi:hypothetical protein